MAVTLSSYSPALRGKVIWPPAFLKRNVALPTGRNPGILVSLPIGGLQGARDDKRHARPVLVRLERLSGLEQRLQR
jgi:hypothetical protein